MAAVARISAPTSTTKFRSRNMTHVDSHPFNVLALAAGVGGLELGVEIARPSATLVCAVEIEAHAAEVLAARMEDGTVSPAPIWDDVGTFDGQPWRGVVDCVTSGDPCQPNSVAGRQRGADDDRWLLDQVLRVVEEVRPTHFFRENVTGNADGQLAVQNYKGSSPGTMYRADGKSRGDILSYAAEQLWPTPRSSEAEHSGRLPNTGHDGQTGLTEAAQELWGTPTAVVRVRSDETMAKGLASRQAKGRNTVPLYLGEQVDQWATPRATDGAKGSPNQAFGDGGGVPLAAQTIAWATPSAADPVGSHGGGQTKSLRSDIDNWATPRAEMSRALGNPKHIGRPNTGNGNIEDQAAMWETPTTALTDGTRLRRGGERDDELLLSGQAEQLADQWRTPTSLSFNESHQPGNNRNQTINESLASSLLGLPAHLIPAGPESLWLRRFYVRQYLTLSSPKLPSWKRLRAWCVRSMRRKLSESFVEWMHGWPIGWTDSENAVTGFQAWLLRSRGELLKLCSLQPIDRDLF